MSTNRHSLIVVGVAATNANVAALTFAMKEARLRGSVLEVLTAWQWDIDSDTLTLKQPFDVAGDAERVQTDAISEALMHTTAPPRMSCRVVEGDPAVELCAAAGNADLLVVGATNKSVVKRLLLGSVSRFCVRHAPCPVVLVPEGHVPSKPGGHSLAMLRRHSEAHA